MPAAVQRALDDGALTLDRLRDAARRTAELATAAAAPSDRAPASIDGLAARCLEATGEPPQLDRPLVAEARPPGGMASGELPWSLAEPLGARVAGVESIAVTSSADVERVIDRARDRTLVVVVRDPHRHEWQGALVAAAVAHPASVIVDVGWPTNLPAGVPVIRTRGVAPALLAAVADRLVHSARRR